MIQVDINSLKKTVLAELYPQELQKKDRRGSILKPIKEISDDSKYIHRSPLTMTEVINLMIKTLLLLSLLFR